MVKDLLISTLEGFGFPIIQQGTLPANAPYPATFFTYFNNEVSGMSFYDNDENSLLWDFDLNVYSDDPNLTRSLLGEAKTALRGVGFQVFGLGYDIMSDESGWTGRGINVKYLEKGSE